METYVILINGDYYVDTIVPVVAVQTSTEKESAKLFDSYDDAMDEIVKNEIVGYEIIKIII